MNITATINTKETFDITAAIDDKTYGKVGQVDNGTLTIEVPDLMDEQYLTERVPGMFGGTLILDNVAAQKDGHALYIVYVNQDMGPYKAGWSLANDEHQPITAEEAGSYTWEVKAD